MVRCYIGISTSAWFLFASCYLTFVEPIYACGNIQMNEKNTTLFRHVPQFAKTQDEGSNIISHYAQWYMGPGKYYGVRAEISVWASQNQKDSQESGASLQIFCKDGEHYNSVEVGFHVSPSLYHNRDVRFYTYWTKDSLVARSAGCYNLHCPGFVPATGAALWPGQAVAETSSYGKYDRYARLSINKDPNSGNWVVYRHDLETPSFLGHFPVELCPGRQVIQSFNGFVNYLNNTEGPPMGSGHFPRDLPTADDDINKVAYFKHIKRYNSGGHAFDPNTRSMHLFVDRPDCYKSSEFLPWFGQGFIFYYGGPSGCIG